jgi:hypothetical protein
MPFRSTNIEKLAAPPYVQVLSCLSLYIHMYILYLMGLCVCVRACFSI